MVRNCALTESGYNASLDETPDVSATPIAYRGLLQVLVRDSTLGGHIRQTGAWQDMSGFSWKTCRFNEFNNSGAGVSKGTSDRPQMGSSAASGYTARDYLAGGDGWNPLG